MSVTQSPLSAIIPVPPPTGKSATLDIPIITANGNYAWADDADKEQKRGVSTDSGAGTREPTKSSRASSKESRDRKGPRKSQVGGKEVSDRRGKKGCTAAVQKALSQSEWYRGSRCAALRDFAKGKYFGAVMVIALLLALFVPDLWVLCGVNNNDINFIFLVLMFLFTLEFAMLSVTDAVYLFSFFFYMDIVGTVSILFDMSWVFPDSDHTAPFIYQEGGAAQENLMLLRAARAAKIGARAGRLSRVVRILRYLPFLTGTKAQEEASEDKGIACVISVQLQNLLATRVACLTIVLVMVIPLFDLWSFPESDFSLVAWVQRLNENYSDGRLSDVLAELQVMSDFYSEKDYGPFAACAGTAVSGAFMCQSELAGWNAHFSTPPRMASTTRVIAGSVQVDFNMYHPDQVKAGLGMATVVFIIFMMVFSGLALSNVVTQLCVTPLERMLGMVKHIASTVFKFSAEIAEDEDEDQDIDNSSEMKLLEKVVKKLAVIAQLQTGQEFADTGDLNDEDIGFLSLAKGSNVVDDKAKHDRRSKAVRTKKKAAVVVVRLEDFGMSQETYNSLQFNPLPLTKIQQVQLGVFTISSFFEAGEGFLTSKGDEAILKRFVTQAEKEYLPQHFHNFSHGVDVCHGVSRILQMISSDNFLSELEQYALLISGIAHDLGHPGVNNGFLSEVGHDLALQYNDRSPLENMHCAKLYTIVANPETNVFSSMTKEQYKEARKCCIEVILHTDMVLHMGMVKELQLMYQMNSDAINAVGAASDGDLDNLDNQAALQEVFNQPDHKTLLMNMILHSADVSNPCRVWEVTHAWAMVLLEEFFSQGDQEKMVGIPMQFLNDRDTLNKPNSQIGFVEFMIAPFFAAQIRLFPALGEFGDNLAINIERWEEIWLTDNRASEEERQKVHSRVEKVQLSMENAKNRIE